MASSKRDADGLTELERRFAVEYLKDLNATKAYKRASQKKCSTGTAQTNGARLLKRPTIQAFVQAASTEVMERAQLSVQETLDKMRQLLMYDVRQLFDADGNPLPLTELNDDLAAAISGVEVVEQYDGSGKGRRFIGYLKKYKLVDKVSVLDKAMKYHGLFEKDNSQGSEALRKAMEGITFRVVRPNGS